MNRQLHIQVDPAISKGRVCVAGIRRGMHAAAIREI
jgi:hypothetical protein